MIKKIMVAMSTILILVSCLVPFSVSADYDASYDYKINSAYKGFIKDKGYDYWLIVPSYSSDTDTTYANVIFFQSIPTLSYNQENNYYFFSSDEKVVVATFYGTSGSNITTVDLKYVYIDKIDFTKYGYSKTFNFSYERFFNETTNRKKSKVESNFVPYFDESVPDTARNEYLEILDDEGIDNYYSNVSIEVTPDNERWRNMNKFSVGNNSNPFLREKFKDDFYAQTNGSPSLYFFTVKVTNRGEDPFTTVITANSKSYLQGKQSVSMSQASADILNMYSVNNSTYITVPGNSTLEYNFNFEEIDHKTVKDQVTGILTNAPEYDIFINFWTKTPGRVTGDNWIKLEDFPGDPSSYGYEDFRSCFSHDFSFKGYWGDSSKKPDGYKDIIKDNPISDLTIDGAFGSVDFNLEPSMDDFKSMIDNSKDFLEFVRYAMANFVPAFVWIIFSTGMTGIIILRILGR